MEPSQSEEVAHRATRSTVFTRLLFIGAVVSLLPKILALFILRKLLGPRSDVPGDLQRSIVRGATTLPLRLLHGRRPPFDVESVLAAPRFRNYDRQLCTKVSTGLGSAYWVCKGRPRGSSQPPRKQHPDPRESDLVLFYLHGGAYVYGEPLGSTLLLLRAAEIAAARGVNVSIFTVGYTLAPTGTFPLQQRQAVAAYRYLLDVERVSPDQIVVSGESAGAHLALTCLMGIAQAKLPTPAASLLLFPWISLTNSSPSFERNKYKDVLTKSLLDRCAAEVLGKDAGAGAGAGTGSNIYEGVNWDQLELVDLTRQPTKDKGATPLAWNQILPSFTWINVGEHDMFFDDIQTFIRQAEADGARVQLDMTQKKPHGWHSGDRSKANEFVQMDPDEAVPEGMLPGCDNVGQALLRVWDEAVSKSSRARL
ncbi:hypothetical protein SPBR_08472 [Sporothrix brasiliensis 5110]|uniref:Alpha/beta hydrolase fold-3 domain-containing protein n=1 Tax=Sporothrix brasiliensis 5110 TaxID=1398154 RepID=A0A0C2F6M6_9PEZI|nr:uncharacterized protein SPBR_08472 [Sporothrix brasiliensis 5110]KIH86633.1 hypothetical protein SPBR_08472 [Sporothrix brasiliensis 5110]